MNPETKIALVLLAILVAGLGLLAHGAGLFSSKVGALITGAALVLVSLRLLAMVWRTRP